MAIDWLLELYLLAGGRYYCGEPPSGQSMWVKTVPQPIRGPDADGQGWSSINGTLSGPPAIWSIDMWSTSSGGVSNVRYLWYRTSCVWTSQVDPHPRSTLKQVQSPRFNVFGLEQVSPWCKWIIASYVRCGLIDHTFDIYPSGASTVTHRPNHITTLTTRSLSPP